MNVDDPNFNYDGQGKSKYEDAMAGTRALGIVILALFLFGSLAIAAGVLILVFT